MDDLVSLIEQYRPGYSQTIEPADELDIEDIEEVAGTLPGSYIRFLKTMGRSIGDFQVHEADFNVEEIVLAYSVTPWLIKDEYLLIAADLGLSGLGYYMDRKTPYGEDDCMIVTIPSGPGIPRDQREPIHAGLEEFLYVEAYQSIRLPLFNFKESLVHVPSPDNANSTFDEVCQAAENLNFTRVPPASRCVLYERGDAALVVYRHPLKELLSIHCAADSPEKLLRIVNILTAIGELKRM